MPPTTAISTPSSTSRAAAPQVSLPDILGKERRRSVRRPVSRLVSIEPSPNVPGYEGLVTDISKGGARIYVRESALPDRFAIIFLDTRERRECRLVWRIGPECGVEFLAGPPARRPRRRSAG